MPRRFVLTGAPGSGKTALLLTLRDRGHHVVAEAATDVIAAEQAKGVDAPWERGDFIDLVVALQRRRQLQPVPAGTVEQVFDRSPMCTLALAQYQHRSVSPLLAAEVERVVMAQVYQKQVLFVRPLGFVEPTAARRISYRDALAFEAVHEQVYRDHGFTLVDLAPGDVLSRADEVEARLRAVATPADLP